MKYPLRDDFRYIQAPLDLESAHRLSFNYAEQYEEEKKKMVERIIFSKTGGCFLLTGYRGVGKTTFVDKVLMEAASINNKKKAPKIIPIKFNIAKELTEEQLMHQIIKRLYKGLKDEVNDEELKEKLNKAYLRTLFKMSIESENIKKDILAKTVATSGEIEGGTSIKLLKGRIRISIAWNRNKQNENLERAVSQATYLDYDAKSAEEDFIDIAKRITKLEKDQRPFPIFVIDELDKLTGNEEGQNKDKIESILMNLKNVLSAPGIIFIIIAGIRFYDQVEEDKEREDSLYQSIFSYDFYLGKDWNIGNRLLKCFLKNYNHDEKLDILSHYIVFHSKGVIRNAIYTFNQFIKWEKNDPYLIINDKPEITYYGLLNNSLSKCFLENDILAKCVKNLTLRDNDSLIDVFYRKIDPILDDNFNKNDLDMLLSSKKITNNEREEIKDKIIEMLIKEGWIVEDNSQYKLTDSRMTLKRKFSKYYSAQNERRIAENKALIERVYQSYENMIELYDRIDIDSFIDDIRKILITVPNKCDLMDILYRIYLDTEDEYALKTLIELSNHGNQYAKGIVKLHNEDADKENQNG